MAAETEVVLAPAHVHRSPPTPMTPGSIAIANLAANSQPCGMTADGQQILQLRNGAKVVITGYRADGAPIYAYADDPSRIIVGVDASGTPIFAACPINGKDASGCPIYGDAPSSGTATKSACSSERATPEQISSDMHASGDSGQIVIGMDASGNPIYGEPGVQLSAIHADATGQLNAAGQDVFVLADGTRVVVVGKTASGDPVYALADDPLCLVTGIDANGAPLIVNRSTIAGGRSHAGNSSTRASIRQELSGMTSESRLSAPTGVPGTPGSCTATLEPGTVPPPQVVVSEDGTKRYVFSTVPGAEPLEVAHQAVIATRDDGTPIFAAGTVLGFTADGAAIVADGRGGTYKDCTIGKTRVNATAMSAVLKEREGRIRDARLAGVLPRAALFAATMVCLRVSERVPTFLSRAITTSLKTLHLHVCLNGWTSWCCAAVGEVETLVHLGQGIVHMMRNWNCSIASWFLLAVVGRKLSARPL